MNERFFLEQALEELESLRDENKELRRKLSLYEEFVRQTKEILNGQGNNEQCRKMST